MAAEQYTTEHDEKLEIVKLSGLQFDVKGKIIKKTKEMYDRTKEINGHY